MLRMIDLTVAFAGEMEEPSLHHVGHRRPGIPETGMEYLLHRHSLPAASGGQYRQRETLHSQRGTVQDVGA